VPARCRSTTLTATAILPVLPRISLRVYLELKARIDPLTGDFLFSTFGGGNHIVQVTGFNSSVPEPGTIAMLGLGVIGLGIARRRRA